MIHPIIQFLHSLHHLSFTLLLTPSFITPSHIQSLGHSFFHSLSITLHACYSSITHFIPRSFIHSIVHSSTYSLHHSFSHFSLTCRSLLHALLYYLFVQLLTHSNTQLLINESIIPSLSLSLHPSLSHTFF